MSPAAAPVQVAACVGGSRCEGQKRFLAREPLVWAPTLRGDPVPAPAGHGCVDAEERVRRLDRKVAPRRKHGPRLHHRAPGVGAGETALAQPIGGPGHVAGAVGGLHAGEHAERAHAGNVVRGKDLRMLEPHRGKHGGQIADPAGRGRRHRPRQKGRISAGPQLFPCVQKNPVAAIPYGVDRALETGAQRRGKPPLGGLAIHEQKPPVARIVGIGLEEGRSPRAQRAVHVELHHAELEEAVAPLPVCPAGENLQRLGAFH